MSGQHTSAAGTSIQWADLMRHPTCIRRIGPRLCRLFAFAFRINLFKREQAALASEGTASTLRRRHCVDRNVYVESGCIVAATDETSRNWNRLESVTSYSDANEIGTRQ